MGFLYQKIPTRFGLWPALGSGNLEDAEKIDFQVAEASMRFLGPDDPQTLISMSNLVSTYQGQGRLDEAEGFEAQI